jgi:hypothetical protein
VQSGLHRTIIIGTARKPDDATDPTHGIIRASISITSRFCRFDKPQVVRLFCDREQEVSFPVFEFQGQSADEPCEFGDALIFLGGFALAFKDQGGVGE